MVRISTPTDPIGYRQGGRAGSVTTRRNIFTADSEPLNAKSPRLAAAFARPPCHISGERTRHEDSNRTNRKAKEASRRNGSLSRGPRTPVGKRNSSRNATTHGLLAKIVVIEGESRRRFLDVLDRINASLKPESDIEHLLIGRMAAAHWRQVRLWERERMGQPSDNELETRLDRQFLRNLNGLLGLRARSAKRETGETNLTSL